MPKIIKQTDHNIILEYEFYERYISPKLEIPISPKITFTEDNGSSVEYSVLQTKIFMHTLTEYFNDGRRRAYYLAKETS
jgi:hypothetical protein